jgi:hypothetical protein
MQGQRKLWPGTCSELVWKRYIGKNITIPATGVHILVSDGVWADDFGGNLTWPDRTMNRTFLSAFQHEPSPFAILLGIKESFRVPRGLA